MIHRNNYLVRFLLISVLFIVFALAANSGSYKDRDGNQHSWNIGDNYSLIWDGSPYVPFGVIFDSKYLSDELTEENFNADKKLLESLKKSGLSDVVLRPGKGIASVPSADFQKIIDLLESLDFNYGIRLIDDKITPLAGYVIDPASNRIDNIVSSGDQTAVLPDVLSSIHVLADAKSGSLKHVGRAEPVDGVFTISAMIRTNVPHVLLLFPLKIKQASVQNPEISDIWNDYERFRDTAASYLSAVKFGKGLKFFADPFGDAISLSGESANIIPISDKFKVEFAAWLSAKYPNLGSLTKSWYIDRYNPSSFVNAAGFMPLWNNGRGIKYMYDPAANKCFEVNPDKSLYWTDFLAFREKSIKEHLNDFADVLKRQIADVPVVHTVNGLSPFFQNNTPWGYDGLSISALNNDDVAKRAGSVLSMADNSSRNTWIISKITLKKPQIDRKDQLFSMLNTLHSLGSKGFVIDLQDNPNIAEWLSEYASISRNDSSFTGYQPQVIYYQASKDKTDVKKLAGGSWWLPTLAAGRNLYLGDTMEGYSLDASVGSGSGIYIWSLKGDQTIHLNSKTPLTVINSSGQTIDAIPNKKGSVAISISDEPVIVRGIDAERFMPEEVVLNAMKDLTETIIIAEDKRMDTGAYIESFKQAKTMMDKHKNYFLALQICQEATAELKHRLKGLEGMNPATMGTTESPISEQNIISNEVEKK